MTGAGSVHPSSPPIVRLRRVSKSYGPVQANKDISLSLYPGKITAILGENGAGKSTLMSILSGKIQPDRGRIEMDGAAYRFRSIRDAIAKGIGMVYQHFTLVDAITAAENVHLGREQGFFLRRGRMEQRVAELASMYGLAVHPSRRVGDLSMGEKQRVEILKLLHRESRVLIFDEPTAVLTHTEAEQLFKALRKMAGQGKAVVFISHKLTEVLALADDIVILRKGEVVSRLDRSEVHSTADLAREMVGRDILFKMEAEPIAPGKPVLSMNGFSGEGFGPLDLEVRKGEIVAIVGVAGNGQKQLVETLVGLRDSLGGEATLLDTPWKKFFHDPKLRSLLSYIPEDRLGLATCPNLPLLDNFLMTTRHGFRKGVLLDLAGAGDAAAKILREYNVQPPKTSMLARRLSGGNLQKLVIGREFFRRPGIIIAEQPTQGLDIGATEEVWKYLLDARRRAGIVLVTGELHEALKLADRIAVMFQGRFVDVFSVADQEKVDNIGPMMAGISAEAQ
ncbi:MAG: ABC transporter ATP-binding protein [Desulfovibrionales bacterium]